MIRKIHSPIPGDVRVLFELPVTFWVMYVAVVGDFNQWSTTATPMRQMRDGVWRAQVDLPYGTRTEFRYLADGNWLTDVHADDWVANAYGSTNSIVIATLTEELLWPRLGSLLWDAPLPTATGQGQQRLFHHA